MAFAVEHARTATVPVSFTGGAFLYLWAYMRASATSAVASGSSVWTVLVPLAFVFAWRFVSSTAMRTWLPTTFACAGAVGTALAFTNAGESVAWLSDMLQNSASAALLLFWCVLYARLPLKKAVTAFASMQLLTLFLFLLAYNIPPELHAGIAVCLPVISCALLCLAHFRADAMDDSRGLLAGIREQPFSFGNAVSYAPGALSWKFLVAAFACALAYGMGRGSLVHNMDVISYGISGVVLLLALTAFNKRFSIYSVFNIALPLVVGGFTALAVFSWMSPAFSNLLLNTGYALMTAVFTVMVADRSYRFGAPALLLAAVLRTALMAGVFSGTQVYGIAAQASSVQLAYGGVLVAMVVALFAWVRDADSSGSGDATTEGEAEGDVPALQVAAASMNANEPAGGTADEAVREDATRGESDVVDLKDEVKKRCVEASEEYSLTKREAEILVFLAFGWSAPRIEQELVLSNSTVKTHIKHIYTKMGVHSRDEIKILLGVGTL